MDTIQVYGTDWCEDTQQARRHLDELGAPYDYIDIEADSAAQQWVVRQNGGKQKTPTIRIGGRILVEPTNSELDKALRGGGNVQ